MRPEFTRRARTLAEAADDLSFSREMVSLSRRSPSDAQRRILRDREAAVVLARAQAWPKNTYQRELQTPHHRRHTGTMGSSHVR